MTGTAVTRERDPRGIDCLATVEPDVRGRRGNGEPGRSERVRLLEQEPLARRGVHECAGCLGEIGEADDVVEMAVGDENCRAGGADGVERAQDRRRIAARIDDDGLVGRGRGPHEVRVGPDRAELELIDGE